jgi:protocatechuate 3,4-dioxygenase beta subunit
MVIRNPLIQWPDGVDQLGDGRSAILQRQQQPGQEQPRVGAALAATGAQALVRATALGGKPVTGALVEIWQCDANGRYIHSDDRGSRPRDPGFQGYGKTRSGAAGEYRFRTIKPVPYPGRAPHIHVAVTAAGHKPLVTQLYVEGARENDQDFLRSLLTEDELVAVTVPFRRSDDGSGLLAAEFDIIMA